MAAITVTSLSVTAGTTNGGIRTTITGTNLTSVTNVLFGKNEATIDTTATNTATSLTVFVPPTTTVGPVTVTAIDSTGTNTPGSLSTAFTYSLATSGANLSSNAASKWKCDVDSSSAQDGSGYISVRAITNFQPQLNTTMQDDSDYDSGAWGSDAKTQLKWQNVIKMSRKTATNYVEDPGQKILRLASDKLGSAAVVRVRWYDRNGHGAEAYEGYAMVEWSEDGGGTADLSFVSVTLHGQGARTPIANPIS